MPEGTCSLDDCDKPIKARGWCDKHYWRWRKYGDPALTSDMRQACLGCGGPVRARNPFGYCHLNPECTREYRRRWDAANAEHRRVVGERWRQANQDRERETQRAWASANRDKRRAAVARWQAANPEKLREAQARWKQANPDRVREAKKRRLARADRPCRRQPCSDFATPGREYCLEHESQAAARRYARRARALERRLYERQDGKCPDADHGGCGEPLIQPTGHHLDHLIPLARNGPDEEWNLQLMHRVCNLRKGAKLVPAALCQEVGNTP